MLNPRTIVFAASSFLDASILWCQQDCVDGLECFVEAERSLSDEFGEAISGDITLITGSYLIIMVYTIINLSGRPLLRSRIMLSLGAVLVRAVEGRAVKAVGTRGLHEAESCVSPPRPLPPREGTPQGSEGGRGREVTGCVDWTADMESIAGLVGSNLSLLTFKGRSGSWGDCLASLICARVVLVLVFGAVQTVGFSIAFSIGFSSYLGFFYTPLHTVSAEIESSSRSQIEPVASDLSSGDASRRPPNSITSSPVASGGQGGRGH